MSVDPLVSLLDPRSYRLEHQFDRAPGLRDLPQQVRRVGELRPVPSSAVFPGLVE